MITPLAATVVTLSSCLSASAYFVSAAGNDSASGRSPAEPWRTLSHVSGKRLVPGDRVLLRRGDVWYESLTIPSSGAANDHIFFGNYGKGTLPKIRGSIAIAHWSRAGENVWVSRVKARDPSAGAPHDGQKAGANGEWPGGSWFEHADGRVTWGNQEKDWPSTNLTRAYDWVWHDGHVYVFCETDPHETYAAVHASQRQQCIHLNNREHITIDGIEMQFAQSKGVIERYPESELHDLVIRNCAVSYIGIKEGAAAYGLALWHSDCLVQNNVIHDCGRRGVSYNTYETRGVTYENVVFENNTFYNGYHTTSFDVSCGGTDTFRNFTFRNNLVYEEPHIHTDRPEGRPSNSIYFAGERARFEDFYVYNNIVYNSTNRAFLVSDVWRLHAYNNVFYGVNPRTKKSFNAMVQITRGSTHFCNNIIYGNKRGANYPLLLTPQGKLTKWLSRDHNLYFQDEASIRFISPYTMSQWASYTRTTGLDTHSPRPADPLFYVRADLHLRPGKRAPGDMFVTRDDFRLRPGSPATRAGMVVAGNETDMDGEPFGELPNIGCFASVGAKPKPKVSVETKERARPAARARRVAKPGAVMMWDGRLRERITATLAAGTKLSFYAQSMQQRVKVLEMDASGRLKARAGPVAMNIEWERLTFKERGGLSSAVSGDENVDDHLMTAFYYIAAGAEDAARGHVLRAGEFAAMLDDFFEEDD